MAHMTFIYISIYVIHMAGNLFKAAYFAYKVYVNYISVYAFYGNLNHDLAIATPTLYSISQMYEAPASHSGNQHLKHT